MILVEREVFDPNLWATFVSTMLGLEVPILSSLPRHHTTRLLTLGVVAKNTAWTFTATTQPRAQLTHVQRSRMIGW